MSIDFRALALVVCLAPAACDTVSFAGKGKAKQPPQPAPEANSVPDTGVPAEPPPPDVTGAGTATETSTATSTDTSPITDVDTVAAACKSGPLLTKVQTLDFPDPGRECPWEQGNNGPIEEDRIRARIDQVVKLELPKDAVICDLQFAFPEASTMKYDDEIFLTFNDLVLAASMDYTFLFEREGNFFKLDWPKLYDAKYAHQLYPVYCLGADKGLGSCAIPPTEKTGTMSLSFKESLVHELALAAIKSGRFDVGWTTLGDNNPAVDCRHDDFSFTTTIQYVASP